MALGESRPAVCLVSGGMDSAVVLAEARAAGFRPHALSFDYGQRHRVELEAAARVVAAAGASDHRVVGVDLTAIGGSALTDDIAVPTDRDPTAIGTGVPSSYVPARNTVFLAVALGWAEVLGATDLFVGVNAVDYSGYPDCRPQFLRAFEALARTATAAGAEAGATFRVHAPLMELSKADIVRRAAELGVDLGLTHTCYAPITAERGVLACGGCDACRLRLDGFRAAGARDPVPYADAAERDAAARSALDTVPPTLRGLERAARLGERAMATGFRWERPDGALAKVREEADELAQAFAAEDPAAVAHELGDVLLATAQLANYLDLDPNACVGAAAERFERRFRAMEAELGAAAREASLEQWMAAWRRAKARTAPNSTRAPNTTGA